METGYEKIAIFDHVSLWSDWWIVERCQQISTVEYIDLLP